MAGTDQLAEVSLAHHEYRSALQSASQAEKEAADSYNGEFQVSAMKVQLQIILQLYEITRSEDHKTQLENLIHRLLEISKREKLHKVYVEILIVQGFLTKSPDPSGAIKKFEAAKILAEERGLILLAKKAHTSLELLKDQLALWNKLQQDNPELYEQVKTQESLAYLEEAKKIIKSRS